MMVKNEAENLERCLSLARPHVDEIVVIDTGSTDGTQEIARRFADVFEEIEWPGSFAVARNYTFDKATGDFILVLDGDEYLPDDRHWQRIRKILRHPEVGAAQLLVRNLLPEGQILAADRMWQERIFRNDPQIRYEGRVHHQVQENLLAYLQRTQKKLVRVEAEIIHTGYALSAERMAEKYTTRIALLEAEYTQPRSAKHRAYYGYQLGVVYYVLKRYQDVLDVIGELEHRLLSPQNAFYAHLLAAQAALKLDQIPAALVHANEMLTIDRTEPIAYYTTGLALLAARSVGDGMLMLTEAYNLNEAGGLSIRFTLNPDELLRVLSVVCFKAGLQDHARAFQALREKKEYHARGVKALIASLQTGIVLAERQGAA
ncbi:MAG: hypothetical protein KatS3mg044_0073 [Rhodothermaceae bacterium]|nr:MAG: hypothetical protein KatS3mg044_0073 [Rhodothermaceae bacterium]